MRGSFRCRSSHSRAAVQLEITGSYFVAGELAKRLRAVKEFSEARDGRPVGDAGLQRYTNESAG